MHFRHVLAFILSLLLLAPALRANNIQVSNATLVNLDGANGTVDVQFTVSWENSWRTSTGAPFNWDAAWVFVKYRDASTGLWQHCRLGTAHTAPAGTTITNGLLDPASAYNASTNYGVGAFVHRSANGLGTFTATNVRLRWNYGQNGVLLANMAEVRAYAIEMVLVPEGSFSVGDGGTGSGRFIAGGSTNSPFQITSDAALGIANAAGSLWGVGVGGSNTIGPTGTLAAAYPKGFGAFYCMKHEISQQAYVDFLNTLTYTQQAARTAVAPNSVEGTGALSSTNANRNGIDIRTPGVASTTPAVYACNLDGNTTYGEATDGLWLACNWLASSDVAAYLDWSGLRHMTELEFEKTCRGPATPVADEFAWGNTSITQATSLVNVGTANEVSGTAGSNATFGNQANVSGPVRVGAFAAITGRAPSGAGYYGVMDLSSNLYESPVTVGTTAGRAFTGLHGDGLLDAAGNANVTGWPNNTGIGQRGGSWQQTAINSRVSDRGLGSNTSGTRATNRGGRGVRRAP